MRGRLAAGVTLGVLCMLLLPSAAPAAPAPRASFLAPAALRSTDLPALTPRGVVAPVAGALEGRAYVVSLGVANEPMILVDNQGRYVWVGALTSLWRSPDNGTSWNHMSPPSVPGGFTDGYALAQDSAGMLYESDTQGQDIWVAASPNGGSTWTTTASTALVDADVIADRPWLATNGPSDVALVYNGGLGEDCAYSTDAGATFVTRAAAKADQGTANAGNLVFDHAGHATYAIQQGIESWRGATPCATGALAAGVPSELPLPPSGAQIFTQLALDASDRLYVAQPTTTNGAMELRAFDGWGGAYKSLVVSPSPAKSNSFGAVATRSNGEVAVAWYGSASPGDPSGSGYSGSFDLYVARVQGFWGATPTVTVDHVATGVHSGQMCMSGVTCTGGRGLGDYMGVAYDAAGNLHVAFVTEASGNGVTTYARLPAI